MKTIVFHDNALGLRGTTVALYDYAHYCRVMWGMKVVVMYDEGYGCDEEVKAKFQREFEVIGYSGIEQLNQHIERVRPDYFYAIKFGIRDGVVVQGPKNLMHSVFCSDPAERHGDVYAVVSEWLHEKSGKVIPFVPHMVDLPHTNENWRGDLGIPDSALVLGRYGGRDTFNINFVPAAILNTLRQRDDLWFLFVHTEPRIDHPRCLYLDHLVDRIEKSEFINTCDAMLHARDYGETFGLAVLEFAAKNKQILSFDYEWFQTMHPLGGRNHFLYLGNHCHKYRSQNELENVLLNMGKDSPFDTRYLATQFSPEKVMQQFKDVFLT